MSRASGRYARVIASAAVATSLVVSSTAAWAQHHDPAPRPDPTSTPANPAIHRAPAGFAQQIIAAYSGVPALAAAYARPAAAPMIAPTTSVSAFAKQVRALSQQDLDLIYSAGPEIWTQVRDAVNAATMPTAGGFHASSVTPPETPADPEHLNCKSGETLWSMRLTASGLERAANVIDIVLDFIDEELKLGSFTFPNPAYFIPYVIKSAIESAAASISLDADLEAWCKGGNTYYLNEYLSGNAPHSLLGFDKQLLAGYGPLLAQIAAAKKQLQDRETTTQQHLAESSADVQQLETKVDDSLHTMIESALNGEGFSELLLLPATKGGYLDAAPVGVKQIVTDALATMQAAKQPVSSAGPRFLSLANDALHGGEYKKAFHFYQLAYQEIAKY